MKMSNRKSKPLTISIEVPDEKCFKHIADAYGLVCQYRTVNKVPHEKLERWLLRLAVEGCNAIYNYHNQQVSKLQEQAEEEQAAKTENEPTQAKPEEQERSTDE